MLSAEDLIYFDQVEEYLWGLYISFFLFYLDVFLLILSNKLEMEARSFQMFQCFKSENYKTKARSLIPLCIR